MDKYLEWAEQGYMMFRTIPEQGICAIMRFAFTVDICCHMGKLDYFGRYSFDTMEDAIDALVSWDGKGHPGDKWICHLGGEGRFFNPKRKDNGSII